MYEWQVKPGKWRVFDILLCAGYVDCAHRAYVTGKKSKSHGIIQWNVFYFFTAQLLALIAIYRERFILLQIAEIGFVAF